MLFAFLGLIDGDEWAKMVWFVVWFVVNALFSLRGWKCGQKNIWRWKFHNAFKLESNTYHFDMSMHRVPSENLNTMYNNNDQFFIIFFAFQKQFTAYWRVTSGGLVPFSHILCPILNIVNSKHDLFHFINFEVTYFQIVTLNWFSF